VSAPPRTYAAVTPARDEEDNLRRLGRALAAQEARPVRWVIVENGSSDGTLGVARGLAAAHPWIEVRQTAPAAAYDRTSPYMRAFHAGVAALDGAGDLVVKLDADVSMAPDYFAGVLAAFAAEPRLGIASGTLLEERGGRWREIALLGDHCWGPTRTYRRACLERVLPLDDGIHYAVVDEARAHLGGWTTATLRHLPFRHHRPEGAGEGSAWRNWVAQGRAAHHMGYRGTYVLARCAYRLRDDVAALGLVAGWAAAMVERRPRCSDGAVVAAVRERQRVRHAVGLRRARA
jgi:biofilm PGA synthesis N-glycosyltransferase PgaC